MQRLLTRATLPVYTRTRYIFTQHGGKTHIARNVASLSPNLRNTTENQILNFIHSHAGFFHQGIDHYSSEVYRMNLGQSTFFLPAGRAHGADNIGITHFFTPLCIGFQGLLEFSGVYLLTNRSDAIAATPSKLSVPSACAVHQSKTKHVRELGQSWLPT